MEVTSVTADIDLDEARFMTVVDYATHVTMYNHRDGVTHGLRPSHTSRHTTVTKKEFCVRAFDERRSTSIHTRQTDEHRDE